MKCFWVFSSWPLSSVYVSPCWYPLSCLPFQSAIYFLACTHQLPASLKVSTSSETLPQILAKRKINNESHNLLLCLPACRHNNHQPIVNRGGVAFTSCVPALGSLCIFWMKQQVKHLPACVLCCALLCSPLWLCEWREIWLEARHSGSHSVPHRECLWERWGLFAERGGQSSSGWWSGEQGRRAVFSPSESFIREILQHQAAWID